MLDIDGVPLRDYLIAQAGLTRHKRVYEEGRRVQYSDSGFLSRPRVERVRTEGGTVIWYPVPSRNTHVPRSIYGSRDEPLVEKFMRKVEKSEDGHWYWKGHCDRQGYGRFSLKVDGKYKTVGAHRWIFEHFVRPLEPGESIDHLNDICGVRNCVNIEHLDPCPPAENARRARVRHSLALREVCASGHVLSEVGTRVDERGTVLCLACRHETGIKSGSLYFNRRVVICAELGFSNIVCENGHRLDEDNALLKSGRCRECHRVRAQASRDRKQVAASEAEDSP